MQVSVGGIRGPLVLLAIEIIIDPLIVRIDVSRRINTAAVPQVSCHGLAHMMQVRGALGGESILPAQRSMPEEGC